MEILHKNLLLAIKSALTGDTVSIDDDLDYEKIFAISRTHQIVPLVFDGLYKAKGNFEGIEYFKHYTFKMIGRDQNQLFTLRKIETLFADNGIDYMLLKGSSIKKFFPASEFRIMSDVDILIKESQYKSIKPLFTQLGFEEKIESDHEYIWVNKTGVMVELHKRLIPSYNDDYYSYYINPWEKAVYRSNHSFSLSKEDEYTVFWSGKHTDVVDESDIDFEKYFHIVASIDKTDRFLNVSIKENLNVINDNFEKAVHICKEFDIHDEILKLKDGYDTILNSNNDDLKTNTKILLNIVRLLLKNTKIMILDEVLSALDSESREKVLKILEDMKNDHTIIIIERKKDVLVKSDNIIFLNEGDVIASGTHQELLKNRHYKKILEN